VIENL